MASRLPSANARNDNREENFIENPFHPRHEQLDIFSLSLLSTTIVTPSNLSLSS